MFDIDDRKSVKPDDNDIKNLIEYEAYAYRSRGSTSLIRYDS